MNTLTILNLIQQKLSLRDIDGLITQTYVFAVVVAIVALGVAILISNSIAFEFSEKPKDPRKRKIVFWLIAVISPILFYGYNLFLVTPNIKKGPAAAEFFMTGALSPVVTLVTYVVVGFLLAKIFKTKKIGTWF
tara:strand:+ start:1837 stop:2238 length:402 start_codon:yes stop_codon:yes gene_type:complete